MRLGKGVTRGSRRTTTGTRRKQVVIACSTLGAVAVGAVVWLVFFSSVFALGDVRVQGLSVLTQDAVLQQADPPLGTPLARVSERAVAERVAGLAAVDEVTVRRKLPDTLDIVVTERVPVFGVDEDGQVMLVDSHGAHFAGPPPDGLPSGVGPLGDAVLLAGAAGVVSALPAELRDDVQLVAFPSREAITVRLTDDVEIFFGSGEQAQLKGEVALALIRGTDATYINVSAPTRPSTR